MAGHSKWANIKHRKGAQDAKRGKIFTKLVRELMVAARAGSDPTINAPLKLAITKAKAVNMPADNIDRAIKKGSGEMDTSDYFELLYEGYAPGGVALLIEILTNNKNRTSAEIRTIFKKLGGSLGEPGCVAYMFARKGVVVVEAQQNVSEDGLFELVMDLAEDLSNEDGSYVITCEPTNFMPLMDKLEEAGIQTAESGLKYIADTDIELGTEEGKVVMALTEALEDNEDVTAVHSNLAFNESFLD